MRRNGTMQFVEDPSQFRVEYFGYRKSEIEEYTAGTGAGPVAQKIVCNLEVTTWRVAPREVAWISDGTIKRLDKLQQQQKV